MIRIRLSDADLNKACDQHCSAICAYIKKKSRRYQEELFQSIQRVMPYAMNFEDCIANDDWNWLYRFLLADTDTLKRMIQKKETLQFDQFLKLYQNRFSAGSSKYVDEVSQYNAYAFIRNLGIAVCPYCDEEYIEVLDTEDGKTIRTLEIDHFFPKSQYPALALCFFNLVPSGQNCNGMKLAASLGMSPYEEMIEECTYLYPDLPVGVNMETVSVDDCEIHFHPKLGMQENVKVLCLEQRYQKHKDKAHRYLTIKQQYDENKIEEMVKAGYFPSSDMAYRILYGEALQDSDSGRPELLRKLKHDLVGR